MTPRKSPMRAMMQGKRGCVFAGLAIALVTYAWLEAIEHDNGRRVAMELERNLIPEYRAVMGEWPANESDLTAWVLPDWAEDNVHIRERAGRARDGMVDWSRRGYSWRGRAVSGTGTFAIYKGVLFRQRLLWRYRFDIVVQNTDLRQARGRIEMDNDIVLPDDRAQN